MIAKENNFNLDILKLVQILLQNEKDKSLITPSLISEKISQVLCLYADEKQKKLDREWVVSELIRRFSVWIGEDKSLINNKGHEPWLTPEQKQSRRYWNRYKEWQEACLPWNAIDALDSSTDEILGLLENPKRLGCWDRRGLVVGHVQSGKTCNYTALICKAADAGYKIIIVLAGMHNNLRSQTQSRLDEGFLGYETSQLTNNLNIIGVGNIDADISIRPNYATNRTEKGDFNTQVAKNLGITPEQRPWLFVVKKNKTVLKRLYKWIMDHVANTKDPISGRKIVDNLELLIIDDEADQASVDTGELSINEDGKPDSDHEPTAINKLIRKILHAFNRKAYVGYTATPFANVFIHDKAETANEGADLFPSSFVVNLGAPSNYIGPSRVFGIAGDNCREGGLPLVRIINDSFSNQGKSGWMPINHKSCHVPDYPSSNNIPPSLLEAIDAFLLACAVRQMRGQGAKHSSMLIHVTRFNKVQKYVYEQVEMHLQNMRQRLTRKIAHEEIFLRLKTLWERDFLQTIQETHEKLTELPPNEIEDWNEIYQAVVAIVTEVEVRMINGSAKDALNYVDAPTGLKVIAIGGDKLSRGLTLEGLCTSYFLRASKMYDTLMQMGRWFGYRPGYLDLCRLYTTEDLVEWFEYITDAAEELREEFDLMSASGGTPEDYGLKVKSHPVLMVTSRLKMRSAKSLFLSFSGSIVETVSFCKEAELIKQNLSAFNALVSAINRPAAVIPTRCRFGKIEGWKGAIWEKNVPYEVVVDFLNQYETHPDAIKVNSKLLASFISSMAKNGELTNWTIAVIGGQVTDKTYNVTGIEVPMVTRQGKQTIGSDRYAIQRLLSPKDESIDLEDEFWLAALEETRLAFHKDPARYKGKSEPDSPSGPCIRKIKGFGNKDVEAHPENGLLLIYLLDPVSANVEFTNKLDPIVAFGISFPGSQAGIKVEYKVNNVMWEQENGLD